MDEQGGKADGVSWNIHRICAVVFFNALTVIPIQGGAYCDKQGWS